MLENSNQAEVRWQLVQCLPRLPYSALELPEIFKRLTHCFSFEASRILRVNCLQALFELAPQAPDGMDMVRTLVARALEDQSASVRARGRKLERLLLQSRSTEDIKESG